MNKTASKRRVRPQMDGTEKRQRLLKVGLKLFSEKGFDSVGMREIAATAGVSLGLINRHFGSKEGLRQTLDEYVSSEFRGFYKQAFDTVDLKGLSGTLDSIVDFFERDRVMMMYLRVSLLQKTPGSQAMIADMFKTIRHFIDACAKKGKLQANVNKEQAVLTMMFDLLGPVIIEPFAKEMLGGSMYSKKSIIKRNRWSLRVFSRGFMKEE